MKTGWFITLIAILGVAVLAALGVWRLGAGRPSQAIHTYDSVIFAALRPAGSNGEAKALRQAEGALWHGRARYAFIGTPDADWSDHLLLPPDRDLINGLDTDPALKDVCAPEAQLTKVPVRACGMPRAQRLVGIQRRPDGPLPELRDETAGRRTVWPALRAPEASRAMRPEAQITMLNDFACIPEEPGDR